MLTWPNDSPTHGSMDDDVETDWEGDLAVQMLTWQGNVLEQMLTWQARGTTCSCTTVTWQDDRTMTWC
jgi:hypothetical protein